MNHHTQSAPFAAQAVALVARNKYVQGTLATSCDQALGYLRQRALVEQWGANSEIDVATATVEQLDTLYRGQEQHEHTWVRIVELEIIPVDCPVPPMLEEAFGYTGEAPFVAFYWEPCGDELAWSDGQRSVVGASWYAWLSFLRHPAIALTLAAYNFGSSETEADYWLILDRLNRQIAVAPRRVAQQILAFQWPPAPPIEMPIVLDAEALAELLREVKPFSIDSAAIDAALLREQAQLQEMILWLDQAAASSPAE